MLKHMAESLPDCVYLTFENEVILDLFDLNIDTFAKRYLETNKTLIIDEFQHAKKGGKNLKYLFDVFPGKKIIISGSSSPDLTIKALRFLTGRCLVFTLLPFSYAEFLKTKPVSPTDLELQKYCYEYITFGGYPEVVLQKDEEIKKTLLQNIYSLFFSREVKDMTSLADDYKLKNLLRALALNPGSLIEYQVLSRISGFDFRTLKRYLNFLNKTFITFTALPFHSNKRVELVKNPKIYFYDCGLRNSLIDNFSQPVNRPDKGALVENFVGAQLLDRDTNLKFWRTKNKVEVDFILESEGKVTPFEVKAGQETNIPSGLASFVGNYSPEKAFVINEADNKKRLIKTTPILFIPYWQPGNF